MAAAPQPAATTRAWKTLVFSHANGFPASTYRALFDAWRSSGLAVHAIEKYGHDPRFPVTGNWPHLRDQLSAFIEHEVGGAAVLVGHSLGGYLSLMAASRRPDLACAVVMLDSPILSGWKARAVQVAKATGLGERFSPGHVSKRRRQQWDSVDDALAHFAAKPAFARWAPGVLRDYIAAGTEAQGEPGGGGERQGTQRRLSFHRDIETAIYNALPHHLVRVLRTHPLRCPLAAVHGTDSLEVRQVGLRATTRLAQGRLSRLEGTHLFPLEQPALTAAEVVKWIDSMRHQGETPHL